MLRTTSAYDYTVTIDDQPVRLKLKRLNVPQFERFQAMFQALTQGRGNPAAHPASAGEPTPEHERQRLDAEIAYLEANAAWVLETFGAYVSVVAGDLIHEDEAGQETVVTDGAAFAQIYGAHQALLGEILAQLWLENSLTPAQKKTLRSLSASPSGSPTAPSQAPGPTPAPAATPAASADCARPAAATAPCSDGSSGMTAPSSCAPVLSAS